MSNLKIPIWMDCDPGQDDVVALALACYYPNFELLGVSTTHGNTSLENTTSNALRFLTALNRMNIPVYPGAPAPLGEEPELFAPEVHGKTGLNGSNLLPIAKVNAKKGSEFFPHLAKLIEDYDGKLSIVATGPLTNIALFFRKYPQLRNKIKWISIMGGGFKVFNKNGNAEFNFLCDAAAADEVVTDNFLSQRMILAPLDVTSKVFITLDTQYQVLGSKNIETASNFRAMMFELAQYFHKKAIIRKGIDCPGACIHDPVALVALLHFNSIAEDLDFQYVRRKFKVNVSKERLGAIEDVYEENDTGIYVLLNLNIKNFWKLVLSTYEIVDKNAYINTVKRDKLIREYHE